MVFTFNKTILNFISNFLLNYFVSTVTGVDGFDEPCSGMGEGYCLNEGVCEPLYDDPSRWKCRCTSDYAGPICDDESKSTVFSIL